MKRKPHGYSILVAIGALSLSTVALGASAFATDTPTPGPIVATDAGSNDDGEILSLLSAQPDVTANVQESDASIDANSSEDVQEQTVFNDDIKAAVLAGDADSAAQLTSAALIVTSVDAPEIQAVVADDAAAHALIIGLPQK
jgi:hypothetical protein